MLLLKYSYSVEIKGIKSSNVVTCKAVVDAFLISILRMIYDRPVEIVSSTYINFNVHLLTR